MALLTLSSGLWYLDYEVEPVEFWPYTTLVYDVVMTGPREQFKQLNEHLVRLFTTAGIKAFEENKCAFGVKDHKGKMWYLGFKDARFDLGLSVQSRDWKVPHTKEGKATTPSAMDLVTSG